jgi:hypothetical protein
MDARTKALKAHRKRLHTRGLKRVEVTVHVKNVPLLRDVAAKLRATTTDARRIRAALAPTKRKKSKSLAEALYDPAVAGAEFDEVFEEIERLRRDPEMMKTRDVEL